MTMRSIFIFVAPRQMRWATRTEGASWPYEVTNTNASSGVLFHARARRVTGTVRELPHLPLADLVLRL